MNYQTDTISTLSNESGHEISIRKIFYRLWRQRGMIVILPLLALFLAAIFIGFKNWTVRSPVVYYVALSNIDKGQYPNGAEFSPQDLLSPDVLTELRQHFELRQDINPIHYIRVGYDSPLTDSVTRKYHEKLSSKTLTQVDIDSINETYKAELKSTMSTGLRIDVNYIGLGVNPATGIAIARALPQMWSKVYSERHRVFLDTKLVQAAITTKDEDLADAASILVVDARLSNIMSGLTILGEDNRLATLTTSGGLSAEDLQQEVKRFQIVYFRPLFATGFSDNDPTSQAYLRDRQLDIADLERRAAGIDRSLAQLRDYQAAMANQATPVSSVAQSGDDSIGIERGALGQIIGLAKTVSLSKYVTKLLDERQSLIDQISSLHKQIDRVTSADDIADRAAFRQQASGALQTLTQHYQDLLAKARTRTVEKSSQFYRELASPIVTGSVFTARAAALLVVAFFAGLSLAVVYALVNPLIAEFLRTGRQGHTSFNAEAVRIPTLKQS